MLHGALAAAVTPLRDGGDDLDPEAFGPYLDFLAAGGLDGILALGTTGEGILLSAQERRHAAELFVDAAAGRLQIAVHCGAQTTKDTAALAEHAAQLGADAVAVISPPYFALDERALLAHLVAAAKACAPTPFYLYEFAARAGYSIPAGVVEALRERAPNLRGLKVSNTPWERFEPYLIEGLDVFVGPEPFILRGLERGAAGAVSGLASCYPEVVAELVREPTPERSERAESLRGALESMPFHAAAKATLVLRGLPVREDVRRPLRGLTADERAALPRP